MTAGVNQAALAAARKRIAVALRVGKPANAADLILVDRFTPPPTLRERLRSARFPILLVIVALLVVGVLLKRAPSERARIVVETRKVALVLSEGDAQQTLELAEANTPYSLRLEELSKVIVEPCGKSITSAPFVEATVLKGEIALPKADRFDLSNEPPADFSLSIEPTAAFSELSGPEDRLPYELRIDIYGSARAELDGASGAINCPTASAQRLLIAMEGDAAEPAAIILGRRTVRELAFIFPKQAVDLRGAEFRGEDPIRSLSCAIVSGHVTLLQRIPFLGIEKNWSHTLSPGSCIRVIKGSWAGRISISNGGRLHVEMTAKAVDLENVKVDGGVEGTVTLGASILRVVTEDPGWGLIAGSIMFVLTTIWGAAIALNRILK